MKLQKAVIEVRYPSAALIYSERGKLAYKWQQERGLKQWRMGHNEFISYDDDGVLRVNVTLRNFLIAHENPGTSDRFARFAAPIIEDICDALKPSVILRVGIRFHYIHEAGAFKAMARKISKRFFALSEEDWSVFGGIPDDFGIPLRFKQDEYFVNMNFGPMQSEQLAGYFESDVVKKGLPKACFFYDYDFFQLDPRIEGHNPDASLINYLDDAGGRIDNLNQKIFQHFKELR